MFCRICGIEQGPRHMSGCPAPLQAAVRAFLAKWDLGAEAWDEIDSCIGAGGMDLSEMDADIQALKAPLVD